MTQDMYDIDIIICYKQFMMHKTYHNHLGCGALVKTQGGCSGNLIFPSFESRSCQSFCGHEGSPVMTPNHLWIPKELVGACRLI